MCINAAVPLSLLFFATAASATPVVYTFTAIGTGSVGNTSFTDRPFRIDIPGDTLQVTMNSEGPTYFSPAATAAIHVDGVGDGTFLHKLNVFDNHQLSVIGIDDGFFDIMDMHSAEFATYQLTTPIGPVPDTSAIPYGLIRAEPLDIGTLQFTKNSNITFTAAFVPEPSAAGVLLLLGGAVIRRRHRCARRPRDVNDCCEPETGAHPFATFFTRLC